jgi:hypothetical protein
MYLRLFGVGLLFTCTLVMTGCFCCRPCGWHGHRCCYAGPVSSDTVATPVNAEAIPAHP